MKLLSIFFLLYLLDCWISTDGYGNNTITLGNCTDVLKNVYNDKLERFDGINSNNMKRYFNPNFKYGSINITDYRSLSSEYHIKQRTKYLSNITSVLVFK